MFRTIASKVAALALAFCSLSVHAAADAATFPTEITLTTGVVLRNARAERWERDYVVVRHLGGIDRIKYSNIAEKDRAKVMAAKEVVEKPHAVKGQVYVTTKGSGAYRFSDAAVKAYPLELLSGLKDNQRVRVMNMPTDAKRYLSADAISAAAWQAVLDGIQPIATAQTDVDGKFTLKIPNSKPVFVFCVASRLLGDTRETNVWAVEARQDEVILNGENSL